MFAGKDQSEPIVHIDDARFFRFPEPELALTGWSATPDMRALPNLSARVEGRYLECLVGLARPDLARHFERSELQNGGFAVKFPARDPRTRVEFFSRWNGRLVRAGSWMGRSGVPDPPRTKYEEWLQKHEEGLFWPAPEVEQRLAGLIYQPKISIVLPVYNTNPHHLYRCFRSVLHQKYPNWQLSVCDDASTGLETQAALADFAQMDPRITVTGAARNGGISRASNAALLAATGEFVVLLDHDDELHPYALLELVRRLQDRPKADILFGDEDKIDQSGNRSHPSFKPGFDPDMLLAFNYVGHPLMLRRSLVDEAGGFRTEYDGAQDWDLLLRCTELTEPAKIEHIAKPLYHWRAHEESTSMNLDAKPYAQLAWKRVLSDCSRRRGIDASVERGLFLGSMRLKREHRQESGLGVITRSVDGAQQRAVLKRSRLPERARFFELQSNFLYRADEASPPVRDWEELGCEILLFVQRPLDNINHFFLEELVSQTVRADCGLVTGLLVDVQNELVSGPMEMRPGEVALNPSQGERAPSLGYMGRFKVVHSMPCIAPDYFAVRTELMKEWGGVSFLSSTFPGRFTQALLELCHKKGLRILFTPYAVATARGPAIPWSTSGTATPPALLLNRNLDSFGDPLPVLRHGI